MLTLYTQQVLGYTPLQAGLAYLPLAAGVASATAIANKLVERIGPRPLAVAGLGVAAAGMALMGHAPLAADYWTDVLPGMLVLGLGAGLSFVSITTAALASVEDSAAGLASGLLSTTVQVGGALGVAVFVGVVVTQRASDLVASGSSPAAAQVGGLQLAFLIAAAVALTAAFVALLALRRRGDDAVKATAGPVVEVGS
jgi:MFS family permease